MSIPYPVEHDLSDHPVFTKEEQQAMREGWQEDMPAEHAAGTHYKKGWFPQLGCSACGTEAEPLLKEFPLVKNLTDLEAFRAQADNFAYQKLRVLIDQSPHYIYPRSLVEVNETYRPEGL